MDHGAKKLVIAYVFVTEDGHFGGRYSCTPTPWDDGAVSTFMCPTLEGTLSYLEGIMTSKHHGEQFYKQLANDRFKDQPK